jgi:hypothetical protein
MRVEIDDDAIRLLSKLIADLKVERGIVWIDRLGGHRKGDLTRGPDGEAVWQTEDVPRSWKISVDEGAGFPRPELLQKALQTVNGFEVFAPVAESSGVAIRVTVLGGELHVESVP